MATIDEQLKSQADYLDELAVAIRRIEGRTESQTRAALEALLGSGTPARLGGPASLVSGSGAPNAAVLGTTGVGDTMGAGGLSWPTAGYNLLYDPTWDGQGETAINLTGTDQALSWGVETVAYGEAHSPLEAWYARLTGGGAAAQTGSFERRGQTSTPFNSSAMAFRCIGAGTVLMRSRDIAPDAGWESVALPQPYLTAGLVLWRREPTNTATTNTATLEIYDATDAVVRATVTFDVNALAVYGVYRLTCAFQPTTAQKGHTYQLRLAWATAGLTGIPELHLGDPILALSFTPDTPPYTPDLGRWMPDYVSRVGSYENNHLAVGRLFGDAWYRFILSNYGWSEWGDGTTLDARLRRTGAKVVTWDDAQPGGAYNDDGGPVTTKHIGPLFVQGPNSMDLAVTYALPGKPSGVTRTDGALISTTVITYAGAQVASVVTTRFGKTITVTPTYSGTDIVSVHRAVA
jgi:hypothetical protein